VTKIVSTDFDEFADSIAGVAGRFVPTARSTADWSIQVIPVGRVAIQQLQTGGATAFAGDGRDQAITIGVPFVGPKTIRVDGDPLGDDSFILVREGQPFTVAARKIMQWTGVTLPVDHESLAPELLDALILRVRGSAARTHTRTELRRLAAIKSLVFRLCTEDGGNRILGAAALQAAEEEIMATVSVALEASSRAEHKLIGRPRYCRDRVIAQALELMEASEGKPLFVRDLCLATRVSERTLRNVFHEQFGAGPMRLLKVRQLCEIRGALLETEPRRQRVSDIARRFGVWDLSLFAQEYKALYSESPSHTLRKPAVARRRANGMTSARWIEYALRRFGPAA
jgi:AraC-like DNA-binding protein